MKTGIRNIYMDILKIISMFMVVLLHATNFGIQNIKIEIGSINYFIVWIIRIFSMVAVNCFVLISGYFLCQKKENKENILKKIIRLWVQTEMYSIGLYLLLCFIPQNGVRFSINQRIIAGNVQFKGIAAGRGVGFTTGLLLLRKGLGMQETPIRPHSWHCRMQSDYQYDGNRKRPPVWRRHRGSLRPRGRNLGRVEGMTGSCGSGCDPAIHARRLRVYHRPRRLRMASRISIFFAARRFEPLNSMG